MTTMAKQTTNPKQPVRMTAREVIDRLKAGRYKGDQWVTLEQVRNGTGFKRRERYCDLLALSSWPSTGIYLEGVEVKVSRSDWRKELDDPAKSAAFSKYCRHWFVAAPKGVVPVDEVPKAWGLIEFTEKRHRITKRPTENENPEPLDLLFVAALVRSVKDNIGYSKFEFERQLAARTQQQYDELSKLRGEVTRMRRRVHCAESFEKETGINIENSWRYGDVSKLLRVIGGLDTGTIANSVTQAKRQLEGVIRSIDSALEVIDDGETNE